MVNLLQSTQVPIIISCETLPAALEGLGLKLLRFHRPSEREAVLCGGATLISRAVCLQQLPCGSSEEGEDTCHMRRRILQQQQQQQQGGGGDSGSDRSMYGVEALVRRTNGDLRALMMQVRSVLPMCC